MNFRFPVYKPHFTGKEKDLVIDCIDSTWISSKGKYVNEFESRFAAYIGASRAISVCNGTVALHVALEALGIGPGDEVLVPTLTYIASANAVSYTGAKVVFVDSEAQSWQIDINDAERKITERTKAIMAVHLYGHPCDMNGILHLAKKHSLLVIEDCAEAIGTKFDGQNVGTFGDVACFSFFGNKTITTGEGGMVVTSNHKYADMAFRLKGQGLAKDREYWHDLIGYNYRMTNICAAIGCAQMEGIHEIIEKKREIANWYSKLLATCPVEMQIVQPKALHSYWMFSILTREAQFRDPLRLFLNERGVETRPLFYPIHQMEIYSGSSGSFPIAESLSARGINLPSYPDLTKMDVEQICGDIHAYFDHQ